MVPFFINNNFINIIISKKVPFSSKGRHQDLHLSRICQTITKNDNDQKPKKNHYILLEDRVEAVKTIIYSPKNRRV